MVNGISNLASPSGKTRRDINEWDTLRSPVSRDVEILHEAQSVYIDRGHSRYGRQKVIRSLLRDCCCEKLLHSWERERLRWDSSAVGIAFPAFPVLVLTSLFLDDRMVLGSAELHRSLNSRLYVSCRLLRCHYELSFSRRY